MVGAIGRHRVPDRLRFPCASDIEHANSQYLRSGSASNAIPRDNLMAMQWGSRLSPSRLVEKWPWVAVILLAVLTFSINLSIACRRLLWFDEIYTVSFARMPDLATMIRAVAVDQTPVGFYLFARGAYVLSGHWDVSVRFLSVVSMSLALVVLYDCARRLTDAFTGLIAPCVLLASHGMVFGYEGRPFGMLVLLSAMSLWLWLNTSERSRLAAGLFSAILFLAESMHFYGLLCLLPYILWELSRYKLRRVPPPKLWAGAVGVLFSLAGSWSQILTQWQVPRAGRLWAPPSIPGIAAAYTSFFPNGLYLLAGAALIAILMADGKGAKGSSAPARDCEKLSWLFLLIPVGGYLLANGVTALYFYRYFTTLLPGVAIGSACFVGRLFTNRLQTAGVLLLLVAFGMFEPLLTASDLSRAYIGRDQGVTRAGLAFEKAILADGKHFITSPAVRPILELRYYSTHPQVYVEMKRQSWDDRIAAYDPSFVYWTLEDLRRHAAETAVLFPTPEFIDELARHGIKGNEAHEDPAVLYLSFE